MLYGRKAYSQCIQGRVGIENHPAIVEKRKRLGDWEADTMRPSLPTIKASW